MARVRRGKLAIILMLCQAMFIVLFWWFGDYASTANASAVENSRDPDKGGADPGANEISVTYPMFQDVHVMMFVGFGFLMTFLKRYGFSSVGFNFLIAAFVIQWATIIGGFLEMEHGRMHFNIITLLTSDFTAASILISFGAVLGKTSALQLIIMALLEVVIFKVNEWVGLTHFRAVDVGGSMFVHVFGAYFGITVARILYNKDTEYAEDKEGSVYHSDLFSMIGTIFLWLYWPSFNSSLAVGDAQHRAVINTYFALASCTITAFIISSLVDKSNRFNMVHIQNSTLAGGVAVGTMADMMIEPWGALVIGVVAAVVSVIGYQYLTPRLARVKFHDTCGVNNLHGMPGLIAGLGGIVASVIATKERYGHSLYQIFPARAPVFNSTEYMTVSEEFTITDAGFGRSAMMQGAWQAAALGMTLGMAIVGGIIVGMILRIPIWDQPKGDQVFDDGDFWILPDEADSQGLDGKGDLNGITITGMKHAAITEDGNNMAMA